MLGEPKGYVIVDKEIKYTRTPGIGPNGVDLTKDYFEALRLKMVPVIDIAVKGAVGNEYIVQGEGKESGIFLWFLDKRDTISGLIPYKILHPEPSLEDLIDLMERMLKGEVTDKDIRMVNEFAMRMGSKTCHSGSEQVKEDEG